MASLATNPPPAKRQRRTSLKPATIEGLKQKRAPPPIQIGICMWDLVKYISIFRY